MKSVNHNSGESIRLKLYCGESAAFDQWLCLAILFVPEHFESDLTTDLLNLRCGNEENTEGWLKCQRKCEYHDRKNPQIHFKEIKISKSGHKLPIAKKWVEYFVNEVDKIYFYVLGIDLFKLDKSYFGEKKPMIIFILD